MIGLRKIKIPNYLKPQFGPHEPRMARPETAATHSCKVPQMTAAHSCTEPPQSPNSFDLPFHLFFPCLWLPSFLHSAGSIGDCALRNLQILSQITFILRKGFIDPVWAMSTAVRNRKYPPNGEGVKAAWPFDQRHQKPKALRAVLILHNPRRA